MYSIYMFAIGLDAAKAKDTNPVPSAATAQSQSDCIFVCTVKTSQWLTIIKLNGYV